MLYKKNNTSELDPALFRNPTCEYRGAPFWAWNCRLEQQELDRQLEILKKMGFGGAHMHVRTGMATPYLSDAYMELIRHTVQKARDEAMLAWLYDEDRWPSGAAGGLVTKDPEYRARYLLFTPFPYGSPLAVRKRNVNANALAGRSENGRLLACYDVHLNGKGALLDWKRIAPDTEAVHEKWYAYLEIHTPSTWYNNQTYVNTLDKAAMNRFIEVTYERYHHAVSEEFGKTIPAIFTDEPQFTHKSVLKYATEKADTAIPWTDDLPETFAAAYRGEDLLQNLPELFWDFADGHPSLTRYHYHDHVCERFVEAFADNCGSWCNAHGLMLTGHMMEEPTLKSQTAALGEAMRSYRGFRLPGIDMLCGLLEYTTAKQAQSASHQYGREGVLSELYGVTNWDFDFRGHKFHGDWQAALGITVRVPHLSWVSMAGEAKRDYPASINYQSPWWDRYRMIEDHFARVSTAMTRGKPLVRVGVIHPIESYWLHWGPAEQTALVRDTLDQNFQDLTQWLLFGGIDFDFISESLLPQLCSTGSAPLQVGDMAYDVIVVPGCETLRSTTLQRLEAFRYSGGTLIFAGQTPSLENAIPSGRGAALAARSQCVRLERAQLLQALEPVRMLEIRDQASGMLTDNLLHQFRRDGSCRWLFLAHGKEPYSKDISTFQDLRIRVAGLWKVQLYDTMTGDIRDIPHRTQDTSTEITCRIYDYDTLLLHLEPAECSSFTAPRVPRRTLRRLSVPVTVPYSLSEPNVLPLDQAEYALDDGPWQPKEEILRLDDACRERLRWPSRKIPIAQPWVTGEQPLDHTVHLRYRIPSEIPCSGIQLAIEDAERICIHWNGQAVPAAVNGWYVDKAIKTVALPPLQPGENLLELDIPFGRSANLEWAYLLGDFGVEAVGQSVRILAPRDRLAFGSITEQGLPFYGGNLIYHIPLETGGGKLELRSGIYRGSLQTVQLDDGIPRPLVFPPYTTVFADVPAGSHTLHLELCGHRRNSFGPFHLADLNLRWVGPPAWRTEGERWTYDYMLCQEGVLTTPFLAETTI